VVNIYTVFKWFTVWNLYPETEVFLNIIIKNNTLEDDKYMLIQAKLATKRTNINDRTILYNRRDVALHDNLTRLCCC
jgi:hypothetical protein